MKSFTVKENRISPSVNKILWHRQTFCYSYIRKGFLILKFYNLIFQKVWKMSDGSLSDLWNMTEYNESLAAWNRCQILEWLKVCESLYNAYKKWRHTIQMTTDRPIHRLNYQWQASIYFNWLMVGQYDVIFYRYGKKLKGMRFYRLLLPCWTSNFDFLSTINPWHTFQFHMQFCKQKSANFEWARIAVILPIIFLV